MPVRREEVRKGFRLEDFRIDNAPSRIRRLGDLWKPLLRIAAGFDWNDSYEVACVAAISTHGGTYGGTSLQAQSGNTKRSGTASAAWLFRREHHRTAIKVWPSSDSLFSGRCCISAVAWAKEICFGREVVIPFKGGLSFDELLLRIHPAASRVNKLAKEHPGVFVAFDLLVNERGNNLVNQPLELRRQHLEAFAKNFLRSNDSVSLSPATRDVKLARQWFKNVGASLDGIIAKRVDLPISRASALAWRRSRKRSADCVVGGLRYASTGKMIGSLLLGLYHDAGLLHHVGFTSSLDQVQRKKLTPKLEALVQSPGFTGQAPGGPSAAGQRDVPPGGSHWRRGWLLKFNTTILPVAVFGMARVSYAGGPTRLPANARWIR